MTEETTVSKPMTDADIDRIESHLGLGPDGDCFVWHCVSDRERLIAEVRRLRAALEKAQLRSIEAWDPGIDMERFRSVERALRLGDDDE